ncbi:hypothetical protein N0V83_009917 [Neocucurbitaria cava]|uniref:Transcription factor Iwr1 domain-containing protein n=1 Tax=Neocucurbitaria cava TaxID=798079 RepID=A0A9W8Y1S9_9PLEO|nr:hypothetical protein N0V83_009917 [Neocucurbitaria cava]
MSQNPPQTLSVKRKRNEAPVDALVFDNTSTVKRQKSSQNFAYRRLTKPSEGPAQTLAPPTPGSERRYHLDPVSKKKSKHVFIEANQVAENGSVNKDAQSQAPEPEPETEREPKQEPKEPEQEPSPTPQPRKRPGARSALPRSANKTWQQQSHIIEPSETHVRELEAFSREVEQVDNLEIPLPPPPPKYKPHAPAKRFAERHPEQAAALASQEQIENGGAHDSSGGGDAMDIDSDEYVYDTYVREPLLPDADGKLPEPSGTVGFLVIRDVEDDDWWYGSEDSDKEFDTDDEDENAEDYYANDYPEEVSEDGFDEFGMDGVSPTKYGRRVGSGDDDEDSDSGDEGGGRGMDDDDDGVIGSGEDEDDLHFKMTVPKAQRAQGYWGTYGEPKA